MWTSDLWRRMMSHPLENNPSSGMFQTSQSFSSTSLQWHHSWRRSPSHPHQPIQRTMTLSFPDRPEDMLRARGGQGRPHPFCQESPRQTWMSPLVAVLCCSVTLHCFYFIRLAKVTLCTGILINVLFGDGSFVFPQIMSIEWSKKLCTHCNNP